MSLLARLARLLAPDMVVRRVTEIDPGALRSRGIEGLILDLDNTLCPWQSEIIPDDIAAWLEELRDAGFAVCIASNTHNRRRLHRMCKALGVEYVQGVPKPRRRCFTRAFGHLKLDPHKVAVAGDQLFTDVLGGKRSGIFTIMVAPMHRREFIGTRVTRMVERPLLKAFQRRGLMPGPPRQP